MIQRRTIKNSVSLEGLGLHSGVPVKVTIEPGEAGIRFRYGATIVEAHPENVTDTRRRTKLGEISTVEHVMSAFAGLEITDAEVEVSAPELPAFGGNSSGYVSILAAAGFESLGEIPLPELFTRVFVQEGPVKVAVSKGNGHWSYSYETDDRWPGSQRFECEDVVASYVNEIAPARTFAFSEEVEPARAHGFGLGLDEATALILGKEGYDGKATFPDEPARHKLLDLIGDLYLSGLPIRRINVSAERSGHETNVKTAVLLRRAMLEGKPR